VVVGSIPTGLTSKIKGLLQVTERTITVLGYCWVKQTTAPACSNYPSRGGSTAHPRSSVPPGDAAHRLYSGTRSKAMLKLRWLPSTEGGWIDVDVGVIHRRPARALRTKKRQPPVRIHKRLLPHLRAWRRADQPRRLVDPVASMGVKEKSLVLFFNDELAN
jgi:hypothetical protein